MRTLVAIVALLVAVDLFLLFPLCWWCGWGILPLLETVITAGLGILVIGYYEWRWAGLVAERLGGEDPTPVGAYCLEKILLVVAGLFLIIPGVLSTVIGCALLLPPVRKLAIRVL
ncbi:MAG: FxsA family protein [Thermoguttaceae bacterium]